MVDLKKENLYVKLSKVLGANIPLFVGLGNVFKRDDAVGIYLCQKLLEAGKNALVVEMSIEKYVGKINNMPNDVLVLIDAVSFNKEPGFTDLVPVSEIIDQTSHTHNVSLKRVAEFFEKPVYVLGIQPENVKSGEGLTEKIQREADKCINMIISFT